MIELSGAAGAFFEEIDRDGEGRPVWRRRDTDFVVRGCILDFYRSFGGMYDNGLSYLGLPRSQEIRLKRDAYVVVQVLECGVVCYDPSHVIDLRPGEPPVYLL